MHSDSLLLETLALVLGGVLLLVLALVFGARNQQRKRRDAMRRGNQIYREWLRKEETPPDGQ